MKLWDSSSLHEIKVELFIEHAVVYYYTHPAIINKFQEIIHGLKEAHHNCITEDQANSVLELVQMAEEAYVDGKLFAALCCLTERALNLNYL